MWLWPCVLSHAAYLWKNLPNASHGLSPLEMFTGTKQDDKVLRNEKIWGCPAYVLDAKLHDGKKLPNGIPELDESNTWGNQRPMPVLSDSFAT